MTRHEALAKRAVACPRWYWVEGMRVRRSGRIIGRIDDSSVDPVAVRAAYGDLTRLEVAAVESSDLPDLGDWATLGALLQLVREEHGDPLMCAVAATVDGKVRWRIDSDDAPVDDLYDCESEAEVLVAALEAAGGGK